MKDFLIKIFSSLKGIIPEKLFNVESLIKVDNRQINITSSSITCGDQTINDPKVVDAFFEKLSEFKKSETLPFQVVHEDLKNDYLAFEELSIVDKESLKKLKEVLPTEEVECILMARRCHMAQKEKKRDLFEDLNEQLEKNYPKNGKKVQNLMNTGYFDELIVPMMDVFRSKSGEKYKEDFQNFYFDLMRFFPIAVFVGNKTEEERIEEEVSKRLKLDIPFVRIHAMGAHNIEKVNSVIKSMKIAENYITKDDRFTSPLGLSSQLFEIRLKK